MSDAAKQWNAAIEDPSKLVAENNRLRDDLGERDECIARLEMRYENDASRWEETEKDLRASCVRASRELEASVEYHANFRDKIDKALGQPRGDGDILSAILFEIEKIKGDAEHASSELANALIREQKLWAENQKLKEDISDYEIEMRSRSDAAEKLARELNTERMQRKEYESLAKSLEKELAAAPHWVPATEFQNDSKFHIVWDANAEQVFDAKVHGQSGKWFPAYRAEIRLNVTHVLVGLNPPVSSEDPRGDGDLLPESECLDKLTRECMRDEFDKMIETTRKMDEPPESEKPKRDLIVTESPNGPWHVWEQKTPGDYSLVSGPFNSAELAHATADKIRAEEDTSNDLAGDASDIERAIRERLMQPFYGIEAENLGATRYQLRDGERWEYLKRGVEWDFVDGLPCWFNHDTYRLAIGKQHAATD